MKKLLAILLSVIMVLSLVACGNKTQDETPNNDDQQQNTETETKTIKVGLICIGDENDQGYTYNFIRGKESATEALAAKGINVDWVVKYNIGEDSTCEDANIELAEEGCELIFNNSYGFEPFMLKVAPDYPEIQFVGCTNQGSWNDGLDNTHNAFANIYEGRCRYEAPAAHRRRHHQARRGRHRLRRRVLLRRSHLRYDLLLPGRPLRLPERDHEGPVRRLLV